MSRDIPNFTFVVNQQLHAYGHLCLPGWLFGGWLVGWFVDTVSATKLIQFKTNQKQNHPLNCRVTELFSSGSIPKRRASHFNNRLDNKFDELMVVDLRPFRYIQLYKACDAVYAHAADIKYRWHTLNIKQWG